MLGEILLDRALEYERAIGGGDTVKRGVVDLDLPRTMLDVIGDDVDALCLQHLY